MRRRSDRPAPAILPEGWHFHDGGDPPVDGDERPGILFRGGTRIQVGAYAAEHWLSYGGNCWQWNPETPDRYDVVAYGFTGERDAASSSVASV